jgi:ABC-2 type transport system permease protein
MHNIWAIFKKELKSYFTSPMAYIIISAFLLISGWFFANSLFIVNLADLRAVFSVISMIYIFFIPAITMRLLAEERKSGTLELLVTLPVNDRDVILGKFLASLALLAIALACTFIYVITLSSLGDLAAGAAIGGYLGLLLVGAAYLSIGIFISSLTENQIIAFLITFLVVLFLYMLDKLLFVLPLSLVSLFEYLSSMYHFNNMARGVIDSRDLLYFGSVIFIGLYLCTRSLKSRKWA